MNDFSNHMAPPITCNQYATRSLILSLTTWRALDTTVNVISASLVTSTFWEMMLSQKLHRRITLLTSHVQGNLQDISSHHIAFSATRYKSRLVIPTLSELNHSHLLNIKTMHGNTLKCELKNGSSQTSLAGKKQRSLCWWSQTPPIMSKIFPHSIC